jgi:hypothetical protein
MHAYLKLRCEINDDSGLLKEFGLIIMLWFLYFRSTASLTIPAHFAQSDLGCEHLALDHRTAETRRGDAAKRAEDRNVCAARSCQSVLRITARTLFVDLFYRSVFMRLNISHYLIIQYFRKIYAERQVPFDVITG